MIWQFAHIWNQSLEIGRPERVLVPRTKIWASELGGSYIDRYLKMKAVPPTNPPNPRSMRKFEAGNMLEWLVGLVLSRAGILVGNQQWLQFEYPFLCPVSGKYDYEAGGKPDFSKALNEVKMLGLPEFFGRATENIIKHFIEKYPNGLERIILEIKSCSNFMMERYERTGKPDIKHSLQSFHYLKAKNMPEAHVVYICKDDLRMAEFEIVHPNPVLEKLYRDDVEKITKYLKEGIEPPKEKEIYFDYDVLKFSDNWKVAYSNYLTMLYGYQNQKEYDDKYKPIASRFNRVLKRVVAGAKITKKNEDIIAEIKTFFPEYEDIVEKARQVPIDSGELEDEE